MAVIVGFEQNGSHTGLRLSRLLALSGIFAACFHAAHLVDGDDAFRTPVSLLLLGLTTVLSPFQLGAARGQHDALVAAR